MLTPAQINEFKTQGYLRGAKVLDDAEVEILRAEVEPPLQTIGPAADQDRDAAGRGHVHAFDVGIAAGAIKRFTAGGGPQFGTGEAFAERRCLAQRQDAAAHAAAGKGGIGIHGAHARGLGGGIEQPRIAAARLVVA